MRTLLNVMAVAVSLGIAPMPAHGQSGPRFSVEGGPGFAVGSGTEDPAPSLPTVSLGAGLWLGRQWGIAVAHVRGIGEDRVDPPVDGGDRLFAGKEALQYTRAVMRYRRSMGPGDLVAGAGLVLGASYVYLDYLKTPSGLRRLKPTTSWGGIGLEMYFDRRVSRHVHVRVGATLDTGIETTVVQPVLLGVIGF